LGLYKVNDFDRIDSLEIILNEKKLIYQYNDFSTGQKNIGVHFSRFEVYHNETKSAIDFSEDVYWHYHVINNNIANFLLEIDSSFFDWRKSIPWIQ
jgi:hypothetical protein